MFTAEEIRRIRRIVFELVGFEWAKEIDIKEGTGLTVTVTGDEVAITAESKPALARAFFRFAQEKAAGKKDFTIHEEKHFDSCGAFLDFSRNGVMTVDACKRYMDYSAALGLNLIVLYTEDTFAVPEYKYMGYLRGRYSQEEIREMDAYAQSLGIELVPCIQTLAHLGNFLQWKENQHMKDQPTVLLIDDEDTYAFIEAEVRSIRSCVSGERLHIGMDEAHGVGLGRYFLKHGAVDRFELLNRHLTRCVEICEKYGFKPMMWSDMFFRLGSKTNEYYDMEADIPQSVIDMLPPVGMVYWDYYNTEDKWYEHMLTQHEKMSPETIFAGGIWTWSGFLPHVDLTYATMEPALKACARHGVKTVMATMWGDDGQETVHSLALSQLPIFSEACWRPESCDRETIVETGEYLTGLDRRAYEAFSLFYPGAVDQRDGKAMIWCDLLYPLGLQGEALENCRERAEKALGILAQWPNDPRCRYASALFEVIRQKAPLMQAIRARYLAGDKAWIAQAAEKDIPALMDAYRTLRDEHRSIWESEFKRNGWEVIALRYGAVLGRLEDAAFSMKRWAAGEIPSLCELEEEPLDPTRKYGMQFYNVYVSPVFNL